MRRLSLQHTPFGSPPRIIGQRLRHLKKTGGVRLEKRTPPRHYLISSVVAAAAPEAADSDAPAGFDSADPPRKPGCSDS